MQNRFAGNDLIRRFTPTPLSESLWVMGHTLRLETNSLIVLEQARQIFACHKEDPVTHPEFLWRVVVDPTSGLRPPWPEQLAFSDDGLRYVSLGQRSFVAVDLKARESIGFLSGELAEDSAGIRCPFFSDLLDLSLPALGLVGVTAASVARARKCLLIFGPPKSGKTTSSYLATKFGLRFLADQEIFLEPSAGGLRVWGDPWPAAFRWDILERFPELQALAQPFYWQHLRFLYLERNLPHAERAQASTPAACIFLEREALDKPKLLPLGPQESREKLGASFLFKDDQTFEDLRAAVLTCLARLPAYRFTYGADPYEAARVYWDVLSGG